MRCRQVVVATAALASVVAGAGCGSSAGHHSPRSSGASNLGGPAPAELVGTFETAISRRDAARAPKPGELPIGPWTLVIGNSGGPNNSRALGVGNGDTDRVVYHFGVKANVLSIRCTDEQGLPSTGSETYTWSMRAGRLTLRARSSRCRHGDQNNQLVLTSHPWTKQGAK